MNTFWLFLHFIHSKINFIFIFIIKINFINFFFYIATLLRFTLFFIFVYFFRYNKVEGGVESSHTQKNNSFIYIK